MMKNRKTKPQIKKKVSNLDFLKLKKEGKQKTSDTKIDEGTNAIQAISGSTVS